MANKFSAPRANLFRYVFRVTLALLLALMNQSIALASERVLTVVDAEGIGPTWDGGIGAFDQEIDFDSCINDSGAGCPNISWAWVEDSENRFLRFEYPGSGQLAGVYFKSSIPQDFRVFQGGTLEIEARASVPNTALTIKSTANGPVPPVKSGYPKHWVMSGQRSVSTSMTSWQASSTFKMLIRAWFFGRATWVS